MDRSSLLNDAFSLAESGHVDYSVPLSMTRYLRKESDLVPWQTVYSKLVNMEGKLKDTEAYPMFRKVRSWNVGKMSTSHSGFS
jgi:glutamyl aminopeptidase